MGVELLVEDAQMTALLSGDIDHHTAKEIRESIDAKAEECKPRILNLDFQQVEFMDSSGIGMIMGRYRQIYMLGGEICAAHANERVKKILTMSGVTKIMEIIEEDQ